MLRHRKVGSLGGPYGLPNASTLLTGEFMTLAKNARRGGHYLSHTNRYDADDTYRMNCQAHRPATPRRLQYMSCDWAAEDGSDFL